jgi:hypothetical protein
MDTVTITTKKDNCEVKFNYNLKTTHCLYSSNTATFDMFWESRLALCETYDRRIHDVYPRLVSYFEGVDGDSAFVMQRKVEPKMARFLWNTCIKLGFKQKNNLQSETVQYNEASNLKGEL